MNLQGVLVLGCTLFVTVASFGQKNNETNAALERKAAINAYMSGDMEGAKKSYLAAKEYVDLALAHADTKESQKTLWLAGDVYANLALVMAQTGDMEGLTNMGVDPFEFAHDCFKKGYGLGKKNKSDIENSVSFLRNILDQTGGQAYNAGMYEMAAMVFDQQAKISSSIDILDTTAMYNSAISYNQAKKFEKAAELFSQLVDLDKNVIDNAVSASQAYREIEKYDEALAIVNKAQDKFPSEKALLTELVNTNLAKGDNAAAMAALTDAIKQDPDNKVLYYVIGTIYMDLEKNEDAEKSFLKALEIDPKYSDVQYQLGAHLYNWANTIKLEAANLDKGDPNEEPLLALSAEKMTGAIKYLEQYLETSPNEKAILDILYKAYYKSGDSEKAMEYKKRLDSL